MIERKGDLFTTKANYIGHGVNCQGVMGAGIAKTIREKYPKTYKEYKYLCNQNQLAPGSFFAYSELSEGMGKKIVVNFATQDKPGRDATYQNVFNSLYKFSNIASQKVEQYGGIVAIPEIGCGIGGLEWLKVKKIIETVEFIIPEIEYEIWHYENK